MITKLKRKDGKLKKEIELISVTYQKSKYFSSSSKKIEMQEMFRVV
jgi:hypothetical protein